MRDWFRRELRLLYGDELVLPPEEEWWTVWQKRLVRKLLNAYGPTLVEKAIVHYCATWPQRVAASGGRLGGIPGIGLLWKIRTDVFAEVQGMADVPKPPRKRARRGKDTDEYRPPSKPMDVGWE
ncbi:MAG: hypothetical protein WC683_01180 [bacterium]